MLASNPLSSPHPVSATPPVMYPSVGGAGPITVDLCRNERSETRLQHSAKLPNASPLSEAPSRARSLTHPRSLSVAARTHIKLLTSTVLQALSSPI